MTAIPNDELRAAGGRVFTGASTLDGEAEAYQLDDLRDTALAVRGQLAVVLADMPDSGFAAQPTDAEGATVWSAGQVISHISQALINTGVRTLDLAGVEHSGAEPALQALAGTQLLDRAQANEALRIGTQQLERLYALIPADADFSERYDHPTFGSVGIKGWLLLMPIHERAHVGQLEKIAAANA